MCAKMEESRKFCFACQLIKAPTLRIRRVGQRTLKAVPMQAAMAAAATCH